MTYAPRTLTTRIVACILVATAPTTAGCEKAWGMCRNIGICEPDPPEPACIDIVCDSSSGSTCNATALAQVLDAVLPEVAGRPGSIIRAWALGSDLADTAKVAERIAKDPTNATPKARAKARAGFITETSAFLLKAWEPFLAAPAKNRSPLAEGLGKVAVTGAPRGMMRKLIVITDGRQVTELADFECSKPDPAKFTKELAARRLLAPGSLENVQVRFSHVTMGPLDPKRRCQKWSMDKALAVREAWEAALATAGATDVALEAGVAVLSFPTDEDGKVQD